METKKIFIVKGESGQEFNYQISDLAAYEDQDLANRICQTLNLIASSKRQFNQIELANFKRKYCIAHPAPEITATNYAQWMDDYDSSIRKFNSSFDQEPLIPKDLIKVIKTVLPSYFDDESFFMEEIDFFF